MNWVAVDWGTTNVRFWLMSEEGKILSTKTSPMGMNRIKKDQYEDHLLANIGEWFEPSDSIQVIACGMVGAANGWVEAMYQKAPCEPISNEKITKAPTGFPSLDVRIIPGIANYSPSHDVLRGEETQICGFLTENPDFEGVLCLPGTHTKWVEIKSGLVMGFRTFMTGELFDVLGKSSILRHSIDSNSWDENEFISAIEVSLSKPEELTTRMFSIRAESLIGDLKTEMASARLAGLLLGLELAGSKSYWKQNSVVIIGSGQLAKNYYDGLITTSTKSKIINSESFTIKGLIQTKNNSR